MGKSMKWLSAALVILAVLLGTALAGDVPPQEILDWMKNESNMYTSEYEDYISFDLPDGSQQSYFIVDGGFSMYGFTKEQGGAWKYTSSGMAMEYHQVTQLVRHDDTQLRADGRTYPDDLGFDILCTSPRTVLSYHYDGEYFSVCGWTDPAKYEGTVIVRGTALEYYPAGSTTPEAVVDAGENLRTWTFDFDRHPATPEDAKALASIARDKVENLFPGYTMRYYSVYNHGDWADATYSRIADGCLHFKTVTYNAYCDEENKIAGQFDIVPVPLSASLLKRLETEPFETLISPYPGDDRFLTDDAIDTTRLPVEGEIPVADPQSRAIIFLTKDAAENRYVQVFTLNEQGEYVLSAKTDALPKDTYLDMWHRVDGEVSFQWHQQRGQAGYRQLADGDWYLNWVMIEDEEGSFYFGPYYFGIVPEATWGGIGSGSQKIVVGSFKSYELDGADLISLPVSWETAIDALDSEGWAVVNNPDPADRLHLRVKPDRSGASLGKFYNGTPVQIIGQKGDWSQVRIGLDGLTGWMMTEYLAMGKEASSVYAAFPQKVYRDEYYEGNYAYDDKTMRNKISLTGSYQVVGVVEEDGVRLYILLTNLGETGYVPQEWMFDGNG